MKRHAAALSCLIASKKLDLMLIYKGERTSRERMCKEVNKGENHADSATHSDKESA